MKRDEKKQYAYWLCSIPKVGNRTMEKLLEVFGTPEGIYYASEKEWAQLVKAAQLGEMKKHRRQWSLGEEYVKMQKQGIQFLLKEEPEYPQRLRQIPDAPLGVFVKGGLPEENGLSVAVIGARDCSEYGRFVAEELGRVLGENKIQVISGMARGIDSISQEAALRAGGTSVAVLGNGVDICYPAQSRSLYDRIQTQGCLLSSYPPGTAPRPQNFPPRNRIVSGLADVVVVIEARSKSGTLITVDMALEQGKEVYVVPGRVTDRLSDGCNGLLKQGAGILLSPYEFVEEVRELVKRQQSLGEQVRDGIIIAKKKGKKGIGYCGETQEEMEKVKPVEGMKGINSKRISINEGKKLSIEGEKQVVEKKEGYVTEQIKEGSSNKIPYDLQEIYEVLDLYPQSLEQILSHLSGAYSVQELNAALMRLCLAKWALQVSPGNFARNHQTITN